MTGKRLFIKIDRRVSGRRMEWKRVRRPEASTSRRWCMSLMLRSAAFADGQPIPRRHTGDGEDLSPPLSWTGIPPGATELALIVDDPDAPTSQPWVHWVIYNLPADEQGLPEGVPPVATPRIPAGCLQGTNSWGGFGYRGPAPPRGHGTHRYVFRLYALKGPLDLTVGLQKDGLLDAIKGHVLAEATLTGTYRR
jgi:Raf kinase inhibitor-like YbhB/YbcL family protein